MTLMVPQDRDGTFPTKLFARYQRTEKALVLALMEMYVAGVSTRKVARITEELCGTTFPRSTVSALCSRLEAELSAWRRTHPKIAEAIGERCEECLTVLRLPVGHRLFLRTNNALERFNQEIKRRTRVVRIFPNEESCLRLVSALCVETSEEWMTNRRFLDMDALREMLDAEREEETRLIAVS